VENIKVQLRIGAGDRCRRQYRLHRHHFQFAGERDRFETGDGHAHERAQFYPDDQIRNEFFAAISPVAAVGSRKPVIRNNSGTFGLITNTRNASSSPGLGFGEPRNVQFALKLLF
jgi:hypothetical protein